jgi:hypothetical protein
MTATQPVAKNSIERVREVERMAETDAEKKAALLWRRWARWSRRWDACPDSAAYDGKELAAWRELRAHLDATFLDHTAFDPAD